MTTSFDYTAKIAALLAKAESTSHEAERDTLLAKASELQLKMMISDSEIRNAGKAPTDPLIVRDAGGVEKNGAFIKARRDLLAGLAGIFHVKVTITGNRDGMRLYGFQSDINFVEQLFVSLTLQMRSAVNQAGGNRSYQTSFAHGYVQRVVERLHANRRGQETIAADEPGTDIVLRDRATQVNAYFTESLQGVRLRAGYRNRSVNSSQGLVAGRAAGDRAALGGTSISNRRGQLNA